MRMNSTGDLAYIADELSRGAPPLVERATSFRIGEALVVGKFASHPALVRFGPRIAAEGGADVPATWAEAAGAVTPLGVRAGAEKLDGPVAGGKRKGRASRHHEQEAVPGAASRTSLLSAQFSSAVQRITSDAPSSPTTPIAPLHDSRSIIRDQANAGPARITTSQPLFGPSMPFRVSEPTVVHVEKTPTTTSASAVQTTMWKARGRERARNDERG